MLCKIAKLGRLVTDNFQIANNWLIGSMQGPQMPTPLSQNSVIVYLILWLTQDLHPKTCQIQFKALLTTQQPMTETADTDTHTRGLVASIRATRKVLEADRACPSTLCPEFGCLTCPTPSPEVPGGQ